MAVSSDRDNDPRRPSDYAPEPDPRDDIDVGTGRGFGVDLHRLYAAGTQHLPLVARNLALGARSIDGAADQSERLGSYSATPSARDAAEILRRAQDAIAVTSANTDRAADALLEIADRYVRTDRVARDVFSFYNRLMPERVPFVPAAPRPPGPSPAARNKFDAALGPGNPTGR